MGINKQAFMIMRFDHYMYMTLKFDHIICTWRWGFNLVVMYHYLQQNVTEIPHSTDTC